jgi:hypothetical protein
MRVNPLLKSAADMFLKFFGFGVLTESPGADICAATDGAHGKRQRSSAESFLKFSKNSY